ncbi:hypothetical protein Tco_1264898 [Tanacetum coccineum]
MRLEGRWLGYQHTETVKEHEEHELVRKLQNQEQNGYRSQYAYFTKTPVPDNLAFIQSIKPIILPDRLHTVVNPYKNGISGAKPDLFLDQLRVDVTGTIIVMIGRVWDVSAVSCRAKGKMIHCSAWANIAYNFLRLKEGGIYSVKFFAVKPNKEEYRVIKDDSFMLEFDGSMTFKRVYVKADGFVKYPLNLVDFDVIEPADNKYLIYVAGYVSNVDKVYLSSTSSTVILDDAKIPAIKALKDANSGVELKKHYTPIDLTRPVKGTIDNLLMWAQNQKNNVHSFPTSLVWND